MQISGWFLTTESPPLRGQQDHPRELLEEVVSNSRSLESHSERSEFGALECGGEGAVGGGEPEACIFHQPPSLLDSDVSVQDHIFRKTALHPFQGVSFRTLLPAAKKEAWSELTRG